MQLHRAKTEIVRLTRQQMLENMVTYYIIEGNRPAFDPGVEAGGPAGCRYYIASPDGGAPSKCGIGCQLTDGQAKQLDDAFPGGVSVHALLRRSAYGADTGYGDDHKEKQEAADMVAEIIDPNDSEFASLLQSTHDSSAANKDVIGAGLSEFRAQLWDALSRVANKYNLTLRPVTL